MKTNGEIDPTLKGEYMGNCNRTDCQKPPAEFYNHSTRKYYCEECAAKINRMNPESYQIFGHVLCTYVVPKPADALINELNK